MRHMKDLGVLVALLLITNTSQAGLMLTDSAVFSTNGFGENWNGWIWNTQAPPADSPSPGRWNMYYSSSSNPQNPIFINSVNNTPATNINIDLAVGTHTFLIYGETVTTTLDPQQHFVLNLYLNGNQSAPDISGLFGPACGTVCAASHWNGLDLMGNSGLGGNPDAQEAGTLSFASAGYQLELTEFTWVVNQNVDRVWPYWDDTVPYSSGSGIPDFVGEVTLRVTAVPEPPVLMLMGLGLAGIGFSRKRMTA